MKPILDLSDSNPPTSDPKPGGKPTSAWERELAELWAEYCAKRDRLVERHQACLAIGVRSPRSVFIFMLPRNQWRTYRQASGRMMPKRRIAWLKQALRVVNNAIETPDGK
jgi:hypothetical protein